MAFSVEFKVVVRTPWLKTPPHKSKPHDTRHGSHGSPTVAVGDRR
jgi:hypothetical protein